MKKIRLGVIGLGCRGSTLLGTILATGDAQVTAVCDLYEDRVSAAIKKLTDKGEPAPKGYTDYRQLLAGKECDVVYIAASWEDHARIACDAMRAGKITALEVGGACDLSECWELVDTWEQTRTPFMFMENCCWGKFELLSTSLARQGKLGTVVHCHGAYGHDLRDEVLGGNVNRHYRLRNYLHRNCENYPTHELGPIAVLLGLNRGNRALKLNSVASKAEGLTDFSYTDKNPDPALRGARFAQGDIVQTVITCAGGETVSLRLDTTLPRFYSREFTVRGTKGMCMQDANLVLIDGQQNMHEFFDPDLTLKKYLGNAETYTDNIPPCWRGITAEEIEAGHGGMDFLMFKDFFRAVRAGGEMPLDVYDAALWMSVTPLSEASVAAGGAPVAVPDFTRGKWLLRPIKDVTELE